MPGRGASGPLSSRHEEWGSRVSHANGAVRPGRAAAHGGRAGARGRGGRSAPDRPAGARPHRRLAVGGGHPRATGRGGRAQHGGEPLRRRASRDHRRVPGRPAPRRHPARQVRRRRAAERDRDRRDRGRADGAGRLRDPVRDPRGRRLHLPERRRGPERARLRRVAGRRHRDRHPGRVGGRLPLPDRARGVRGQRHRRRRVVRLPRHGAARRPGDRHALRAGADRDGPGHLDHGGARRRPQDRQSRAARDVVRLQLPPAAVPAALPRCRRLADPRRPSGVLAQLPHRARRRPVRRRRALERRGEVHAR